MPQRICIACRTIRPKRDLVRIVRTPEGDVVVDESGKRNGRGAYLCRQRTCWEQAFKHRAIGRALRVEVSEKAMQLLQVYAKSLPETLPVEVSEQDSA